MSDLRIAGSFRDPSGFVFERDGILLRQVNRTYAPHLQHLLESGLYEELRNSGLLVAHDEVDVLPAEPDQALCTLRPERIPFVSYPYEWSFGQLRDAALLTLEVQGRALARGLTLKDASAYNVQFRGARPVFIDTLSFETYVEGAPWVAYRQFCQHFLAPLALMAKVNVSLGQLLRVHLDGVPLPLASQLLPWRTRFSFGLQSHIHLHASFQQRYENARGGVDRAPGRVQRNALLGLLDSLKTVVEGLRPSGQRTEWGDYYEDTNYTPEAFAQKSEQVSAWVERCRPDIVWDVGANRGIFSHLAARTAPLVIALDGDPLAVDRNYAHCRREAPERVLPLLIDWTNPSPGLGWDGRERMSLEARGPGDMVLALALVHHLALSNNVPLPRLAQSFAQWSRWLVMEFVPKEDSQVKRLLASRVDVFPDYTREGFETAFGRHFTIEERVKLRGSERVLYLLRRR